MSTVLAVIPARGGSKSIPRKNIKLLAGKPLIAWTIEAALQSQMFSRVIVSTDDKEIAEVARDWGAEVPFMRPVELAQDNIPGIAPILHAIEWLAVNEQDQSDLVMCLQPTSPLRIAQDIQSALELQFDKNADGVVSVCPVKDHPYWMKQLNSDGRMCDFMTLDRPVLRRQDLPLVYALNGAIYLAPRDVLLVRKTWYTDKTYAYVMPPERSLDIDTVWDWWMVELALKEKHESATN